MHDHARQHNDAASAPSRPSAQRRRSPSRPARATPPPPTRPPQLELSDEPVTLCVHLVGQRHPPRDHRGAHRRLRGGAPEHHHRAAVHRLGRLLGQALHLGGGRRHPRHHPDGREAAVDLRRQRRAARPRRPLLDRSPTEDYPAAVLGTGALDGTQYGVPVGINSYTIIANHGPARPATASTCPTTRPGRGTTSSTPPRRSREASGGAVAGTQSWGFEDGGLNNWLRQHGERALQRPTARSPRPRRTSPSWWEFLLDATNGGGTPDPSATIERESGGLAESFTATNQSAFGPWWSNQVAGAPRRERPEPRRRCGCRPPTRAQSGCGLLQAVDVLVGVGQDRAPRRGRHCSSTSSPTARRRPTCCSPSAACPPTRRSASTSRRSSTRSTRTVVDFLDDLAPQVGDAPPATPPGGGAIEAIIDQHTQKVLFGEMTPEEAAASFIAELQQALDDAAI